MKKRKSINAEANETRLERDTRRQFLQAASTGVGSLWLASQGQLSSAASVGDDSLAAPAGKVKRVIFLHMIGAPSQLELFDHKPILQKFDGKDCPQHYLEGQSFAFIQGTPKMLGPQYSFKQHGESGA